jgi:primosomal protein N' (replication factor Y)
VAVDSAAKGFFTYSVPEGMDVRVGQMVLVEFGRREAVGSVMRVASGEKPPPFALKPVMEILRPEPLFGEGFAELVGFVSSYYMYPEGLAVKEILPGGVAPKLAKKVTLTEDGMALPPEPGGAERPTLELLKSARQEGVPWSAFKSDSERRHVSSLVRRGLARFSWDLASRGTAFSFEWIVAPTENSPEGVRLGKNEKDLWERLKGAPPTQLSHFKMFYKTPLITARSLEKKGLCQLFRRELSRDDPSRAIRLPQGEVTELTPDQESALGQIGGALEQGRQQGFLLFGVTGSGKTEVYLRAAEKALKMGKGVLWLAPEIALAMGLESRVKSALPGLRVSVLHSALSAGERHDHWLSLERGASRLALGARSAVFAPVKDLGLVIVDEEHDWAYKQEDGLRYHGRDLALWRARQSGAAAVLGSATPSMESYYGTLTGRLTLLTMESRPGGALLPEAGVFDRRSAPRGAKVLSPELRDSLAAAFARGEQALLFLNRRGHSSTPVCVKCGEALKCPYCSLTLTLHGPRSAPHPDAECGELGGIPEGSALVCHGCGWRSQPKDACPACGAGIVRYLGIGTEKLTTLVEKEFGAKGLRMDADSTRSKGGSKEILEAFGRGDADFMAGTQMAAKGHDFANLTVVGVVDADIGLHMPDFRAAERTFQLLSQAAGRAGRAKKPGKVIIQTFNPGHYAVQAAAAHDYLGFFKSELETREALCLPPLSRLALLRFSADSEELLSQTADRAAAALQALVKGGPDGEYELLGPAQSPIYKLKERFRAQIMLRAKTHGGRRKVLEAFVGPFRKTLKKGAAMTVDVDPYHMM